MQCLVLDIRISTCFFHIFFTHPGISLCFALLTNSICLFFPYLSHAPLYFSETCTTVYLMKSNNFRLKFLNNSDLEGRIAKSLTADNSIIIISLNSKRLIYTMMLKFLFYSKQLFWLWVMLSLLEFNFNWSVIIIDAYTYSLNQIHAICHGFEICDH